MLLGIIIVTARDVQYLEQVECLRGGVVDNTPILSPARKRERFSMLDFAVIWRHSTVIDNFGEFKDKQIEHRTENPKTRLLLN
jgi:hypothetical protein